MGVTSSLDRQLANLTQVVQTLASSVVSMHSKPCGICSIQGHPTDMCPSLQEDGLEQANALGYQGPSTYQGQGPSWPKYDPYSSTYNPKWRHHPNLSYGNLMHHHLHCYNIIGLLVFNNLEVLHPLTPTTHHLPILHLAPKTHL